MRAEFTIAGVVGVALAAVLTGGCTAPKGSGALEAEGQAASGQEHTATLEAELEERNREVSGLRSEIDQLRQREDDLTTKLKQALRSRPGKTISDKPSASTTSSPAPEATIKTLQEELRRERQRRQQLEQQLARLKAETSTPPMPDAVALPAGETVIPAALEPPRHVAEADLDEAPAPTSEDIPEAPVAAQRPHGTEPPPPATSPAHNEPPSHAPVAQEVAQEVAALRERGLEQETRHQTAVAELALVLDADRRRQEDLEAQIAALQGGAPGTVGAVTADTNEVHHLQKRLQQERRKNAELMAKLKLAGRVTDLVFRMQNQGAPQPPAPAPRFPQVSQQDPGPNAPDQPYIDQRGEVNQPIEPRVPNVREPGLGGAEGVEVPQLEQPPVFPEGEVETEEVTQD